MKRLMLVLMLVMMCSSNAMALSGNDLLGSCNDAVNLADGLRLQPTEVSNASYCIGYLSGFTDSMQLAVTFNKIKNPLYCFPPDGIENDQLARIVAKWLKNHPENLHQSARMEVLLAFKSSFPCNK